MKKQGDASLGHTKRRRDALPWSGWTMILNAQPTGSDIAIDLTPVIDMVFNLLIFFLVATSFHQLEREMKIALPHAASAGPISAMLKEIVVNVDAEGGR